MAEEGAVQDNGTTGGVVLDGEKEKEGETQGETKETDEDKDKQKLDSALGRITGMQSKIDGQEAKFSSLDDKLDTIIQTMAEPKPQAPPTEVDLAQDPDYMPTTQVELDAWYDKRKTADIKADRDYSNAYTVQIDGLAKGEESKEVHGAIVKEMMDNFNVRHSEDGVMDADLNYSKASRSYYKKQLEVKGKTNPLTGPDKDKPPLGGGLEGEEMKEKETAMPKLDADAQAFIKDVGMEEKSVKEALTGPSPAYLGGR
jgi:hypothetical protein